LDRVIEFGRNARNLFRQGGDSMEDVTELISRVSRELGPNASDDEISEKVLEAIESLPESDREQVLEQVVKGVSSSQLRHLDKEVEADRQAEGGKSMPNSDSAP
jgi:hypothetical protein